MLIEPIFCCVVFIIDVKFQHELSFARLTFYLSFALIEHHQAYRHQLISTFIGKQGHSQDPLSPEASPIRTFSGLNK